MDNLATDLRSTLGGADERPDTEQMPAPETNGRKLLVLYGTETGHSQEVAEEIADAAERLRFSTSISPMNDVSLKQLVQYSLAVFVTSTTGQGDIPANAEIFWKSLLRKKLPPTCLRQLHFTIFGLGDSSYPKFNWAARKLQKRLLQLGALQDYAAGEGDERHDNGIDSIYRPWFQDFKSYLCSAFPLSQGVEPIPDDELLPPKYPIAVNEMDSNEERWKANADKSAARSHIHHPKPDSQELDDRGDRHGDVKGLGQLARQGGAISERMTARGRIRLDDDNILKDYPVNYDLMPTPRHGEDPPDEMLPIPFTFEATLTHNIRVTPASHWQDVRLIRIEIEDIGSNEPDLPMISPGHNIVIYPKNFPSDAQKLIDMMEWQADADKSIVWNSRPGYVRCPSNLVPLKDCTLRDILLHNLDINAVPNRTFLKQLRRHTSDEREKERLLELTQEENTQEFYDYTSRPRRTILEVLEDFPGVKIPISYALEIFPVIRGRPFSIANNVPNHWDTKASYRTIELLVALVEYKTIIRKPREGLCSKYVKSLREGQMIRVGITGSNYPPQGEINSRRPLIAVATGTGVAPIRSLINNRALAVRMPGPSMLFFGCRNKDADFYFKQEWDRLSNLQVIPAFSRDPVSLDDNEFLDPYSQQAKKVVKPDISFDTDAAPITRDNTPWMRSFDYDRGKMYVQHQIRRHAAGICELVRLAGENGTTPIIMICGNAGRMPVSVRHALEDALVIGGAAEDNQQAKHMLQDIGIWMETW